MPGDMPASASGIQAAWDCVPRFQRHPRPQHIMPCTPAARCSFLIKSILLGPSERVHFCSSPSGFSHQTHVRGRKGLNGQRC